jgi:hypothetical protein
MKVEQPRSTDGAEAAAFVGVERSGNLGILDAPFRIGYDDASALLST